MNSDEECFLKLDIALQALKKNHGSRSKPPHSGGKRKDATAVAPAADSTTDTTTGGHQQVVSDPVRP
jgi:hypothetical protein